MANNELNGKEVIRAAMKERSIYQVDLADRLGMLQSSISRNLNGVRMGLDVFRKAMDAMDYDVCIVDRETGEIKWTVTE